jgi:hypothetical protein
MKNIIRTYKRYTGFLGVYLLIACWTPPIWFMTYLMDYHNMESFDITRVGSFGFTVFIVLALFSFLSQWLLAFIEIDEKED